MLPVALLIQAGLGAALIVARQLPVSERSRVVRGVAVAGAFSALGLLLARGSETAWGTLSMDDRGAPVAAVAVFCAWLLVAATDEARGRWDIGALVGAASAALIGFSLNDWVAPALLFWVCVSAATAVAARADGAGLSAIVIGISDACVVGALIASALREQTWRMPDGLEGWPFLLAAVGAIVRAGVLPRIGPWDLSKSSAVALIPLLIGGVFALVPSLSAGDEVALALPLLGIGMLGALRCVVRSPQVVLAAGWLVSTMLALVFIEPQALAKAASAAVLATTVVLLWPWAAGRAGPERGLLLAAVPLTVGFGPVLGGALASFQRASAADSVLSAAPWTAFAALLPVALALGITMGAAMARRVEPETYRPAAVLATWAAAALALLLGLTGGADLGSSFGGEVWLYVLAALVAGVSARFAPRQAIHSDVVGSGPAVGLLALSRSLSDVAARTGVFLVTAALLAALWFTYVGLKTGFL